MPVYLGLITIGRDGQYWPPGTPHELSELEARALGSSRVVLAPGLVMQRETDPVQAIVPTAETAVPAAVVSEPIATVPPVDTESAGPSSGDAPSAEDPAPPAPSEADGASKRLVEIVAAFDLLEPGDWIEKGKNAGRPKQAAIEAIVGFDVTAEEVTAALALREQNV